MLTDLARMFFVELLHGIVVSLFRVTTFSLVALDFFHQGFDPRKEDHQDHHNDLPVWKIG
ncbi:MAG: hypothetical protein OSA93_13145 [Akkermansiaceae bacterium]|nr:hypothetical protein [Akkermansiaceae bacterium]